MKIITIIKYWTFGQIKNRELTPQTYLSTKLINHYNSTITKLYKNEISIKNKINAISDLN